jgi:hypothetical protein
MAASALVGCSIDRRICTERAETILTPDKATEAVAFGG